jgi:hypothetical protein
MYTTLGFCRDCSRVATWAFAYVQEYLTPAGIPTVLTLKEAPLIEVRGESERDGTQW